MDVQANIEVACGMDKDVFGKSGAMVWGYILGIARHNYFTHDR